jgi:MFS transporter, YQGE family, putative transporter
MASHKLTSDERTLVVVQGFYNFISSLAAVFLSIYLFKIGSFVTVALFYFFSFLALFITIIASGFMLNRHSSRNLVILGFSLSAIFWAFLFILKQNSLNYLIPLALLQGTAGGLFWSGFNVGQYVATHDTSRTQYLGKSNSLTKVGQGIAPILGGIIVFYGAKLNLVALGGYELLFLTVCFLFIISVIIAWKLTPHTGVSFSLSHVIAHHRSFAWKMVLLQQFILGLFDTSFSVFAGILIFIILNNEFKVGIFNSITYAGLGVTYFIAPRFLKKWPQLILPACVISGLSLFIFGWMINFYGAVILVILTWLASPFRDIPLMRNVFTGIDTNPDSWQTKYHMFIERDSVLGFGRVLSYAILFTAFSAWGKVEVAATWIKIIAILPIILGVLLVYKKRSDL